MGRFRRIKNLIVKMLGGDTKRPSHLQVHWARQRRQIEKEQRYPKPYSMGLARSLLQEAFETVKTPGAYLTLGQGLQVNVVSGYA